MPVYRHKDRKRRKFLYYYEFQYLGERRKKSGFLSREEAERAELAKKEKIRRMKNGEYELDEKFNDYIESWLNNRRDLGDNTKANYQTLLKNHILPFFGEYRVNTVKAIDVKNFLDNLYEKNLSSSTIKKNYNLINRMYNKLVRMELLKINPCNQIDKPKEENAKIEVFDEKELKQFLEFAEGYTRYAFAFKLAVKTGMRRGEILALKWNRVDLNNKTITINKRVVKAALGTDRYLQDGTKNTKERRIAISDDLIQDIIKHQEIQQIEKETNKYDDKNLVIATQNGNVVSPDNFTRIFRNTLKASGINKKLSLHALRHTHATLMLAREAQMKVVSERLGHSSIKITMDTYAHLLPNMDHDAMEKFGEIFN